MKKQIKRAFLDTEDGQILYRVGGDGKPLLLLHMNPRSSDEYRELMPIFAQQRRVMAMDLMGFGDSDKPPWMYHISDYAKNVIVPEATPDVLSLMPTGVSALVALEQVGEMGSQEIVMVTAAGGGTGHIAVQLAKLAGNHVIGTCGSEAKSQLLKELGCDRVINYRLENVADVLQQEYPQGIDLVFECIGKKMFDTCVDNLAVRGRLVVVGFISEYGKNLEQVSQSRIYDKLFWKAASIRGFLMPMYQEYIPEARDRLFNLFHTGQIKVTVDTTDFNGIESIPAAVDYLLEGKNCGKVVVKF